MFDLGWTEILVIAIVLIVVVGPKDLPRMLRTFGRTMSRLRSMAGEFRGQFDEALKEAELDEVRKTINEAQKLNPTKGLKDAINPLRKAGEDIRSEFSKPVAKPSKPADAQPPAADAPAHPVAGPGHVPDETPKPEKVAAVKPATSPAPSAAATEKLTGAARSARPAVKTPQPAPAVTNGAGPTAKPIAPPAADAPKAKPAKAATSSKSPAAAAAPRRKKPAKKEGDA
jgi:sec-independent protein translocase protein TatB